MGNRTSSKVYGVIAAMLLVATLAAHTDTDEQAIHAIVDQFRLTAVGSNGAERLRPLLASDFVQIGPDGAMTTAWRLRDRPAPQSHFVSEQELHIRTFGDLGVAASLWRSDDPARDTAVMEVFLRRSGAWRLIAAQVGGRAPAFTDPIDSTEQRAPLNPPSTDAEIRSTWARFMDALNLRTASGERAEDHDVIRAIFAADALYVDPSGHAWTRDDRLALGHNLAKQLRGDEKAGTTVVHGAYVPDHVDVQLAVFGDVAVWTSRNPANRDQSVRVWQKRGSGWQMVAMHHGMSFN